ncbi:MAG: DUF6756 family protein [Bacteroidota bacterium]
MVRLKERLLKVASALEIQAEDFDSVSIYEWPSIMKKIESRFIVKKNSNIKFNWWRENFKEPHSSRWFLKDDAMNHLHRLIPEEEKVWFVGCDTRNDATKFWLFEGRILSIQRLLTHMYGFEYYLVSKKYEWLLFDNRHSTLIALGAMMEILLALSIENTIDNIK